MGLMDSLSLNNKYIFLSLSDSVYHPLRSVIDGNFVLCSLRPSNLSDEALLKSGVGVKDCTLAAELISCASIFESIPRDFIESKDNCTQDSEKENNFQNNSVGESHGSHSEMGKHSVDAYDFQLVLSALVPLPSLNAARKAIMIYNEKHNRKNVPIVVMYQGLCDDGPSYLGQGFNDSGYIVISASCKSSIDSADTDALTEVVEVFKRDIFASSSEFSNSHVTCFARYSLHTTEAMEETESSTSGGVISGDFVVSSTGLHNMLSPTASIPAGCNATLFLRGIPISIVDSTYHLSEGLDEKSDLKVSTTTAFEESSKSVVTGRTSQSLHIRLKQLEHITCEFLEATNKNRCSEGKKWWPVRRSEEIEKNTNVVGEALDNLIRSCARVGAPSSIDFTERLCSLLLARPTAASAIAGFQSVFDALRNGSLFPFVHKENQSRLAQHLRDGLDISRTTRYSDHVAAGKSVWDSWTKAGEKLMESPLAVILEPLFWQLQRGYNARLSSTNHIDCDKSKSSLRDLQMNLKSNDVVDEGVFRLMFPNFISQMKTCNFREQLRMLKRVDIVLKLVTIVRTLGASRVAERKLYTAATQFYGDGGKKMGKCTANRQPVFVVHLPLSLPIHIANAASTLTLSMPCWWSAEINTEDGIMRSLVCSSASEFGCQNIVDQNDPSKKTLNSEQIERVVKASLKAKKNTSRNDIISLLRNLGLINSSDCTGDFHQGESCSSEMRRIYIIEKRHIQTLGN
eukprot:g5449.t1